MKEMYCIWISFCIWARLRRCILTQSVIQTIKEFLFDLTFVYKLWNLYVILKRWKMLEITGFYFVLFPEFPIFSVWYLKFPRTNLIWFGFVFAWIREMFFCFRIYVFFFKPFPFGLVSLAGELCFLISS